jgi:hypothetical protein
MPSQIVVLNRVLKLSLDRMWNGNFQMNQVMREGITEIENFEIQIIEQSSFKASNCKLKEKEIKC